MWALWADACFLGEVEINEFGMELSSGEERRQDGKRIVDLKDKRMEWDLFFVEVCIGVLGLDAMLEGEQIPLVMGVCGNSIGCRCFGGMVAVWRCFEVEER